jgi:hypothetical protein
MNNLTGGRKRGRGLRRTKNRRSSRKMRSYRGGWSWPWSESNPNGVTTNTWGQWFGSLASSAQQKATDLKDGVVAESSALMNSSHSNVNTQEQVQIQEPLQEQVPQEQQSYGGKGSRRRRTRTKRNKKTRKP